MARKKVTKKAARPVVSKPTNKEEVKAARANLREAKSLASQTRRQLAECQKHYLEVMGGPYKEQIITAATNYRNAPGLHIKATRLVSKAQTRLEKLLG